LNRLYTKNEIYNFLENSFLVFPTFGDNVQFAVYNYLNIFAKTDRLTEYEGKKNAKHCLWAWN